MGDVVKPPIMFEIVGDVGDIVLVNQGCGLLTVVSTGLKIGLVWPLTGTYRGGEELGLSMLKYSLVRLSGEGMR